MDNINLFSLVDQFSSDEQCLRALEGLRWPNGVITCTRCGDWSVFELPVRHKFKCRSCKHQFTVTSGTIMHDSHLPLRKWFFAIYLMCESKKGMSALQIQRTIDVAYRTAWYLCHRIREAMGNDKLEGPTLFGVVEVDETLVGGKKRGLGKGYRGNKTWVAGAIQRGGQVRLARIPNIRKKTLHKFVANTVRDEAEAIYTDELKSYIGIEDHDTRHETVNHSAEEWVVGDVHTNSIESVWSLFKRSIMGAFHKVSTKHLDRYLEELEWRFNNRDNRHIFRDTLKRIVNTDHVTYRAMVA